MSVIAPEVQSKIQKTIKALKFNNMDAYFVENKADFHDKIRQLLPKGSSLAVGGSVTLDQLDVLSLLRNGDYIFYDRHQEGLTPTEIGDIHRKAFISDAYICSSNAITESGELFNVDGNGNRVAAMIFGPKSVIVIVGYNKIVADEKAAIDRVESLAAPLNVQRLHMKTPCAVTKHCMNCSSPDRICANFVWMKKQRTKGRIKVIIVGEELGY